MKSFGVRYFVSVVLLYFVDIVESQSIFAAGYQPLTGGYSSGGYVDPNALPKVNNGIYSYSNNYALPKTTVQPPKWYEPTASTTVKPDNSKWYAPSVVFNEEFKDPSEVTLIERGDFDDNLNNEWSFQDSPVQLKHPAKFHNGNRFISKHMAKMIMMGLKMALMFLVGLGLPIVTALTILAFVKLVLGVKVAVLSYALSAGFVIVKYYLHQKHKREAYRTALATVQTVADSITASGLPFWGPALLSSGASSAAALTGVAALFGFLFGNSTNTTTTTVAPAQEEAGRYEVELLHLPLPDEGEPEEQLESEYPEESATPKPTGIESVPRRIVETTKDFLNRWRKFLIIS